MTNVIFVGWPLVLPVHTVNCVQTLKADALVMTELTLINVPLQLLTAAAHTVDVNDANSGGADGREVSNVRTDNARLDVRTYQIPFIDSGCGPVPAPTAVASSVRVDRDGLASLARCAFSGRNLHSRMQFDRTHVRLKRTCVYLMAFLSEVHSLIS